MNRIFYEPVRHIYLPSSDFDDSDSLLSYSHNNSEMYCPETPNKQVFNPKNLLKLHFNSNMELFQQLKAT